MVFGKCESRKCSLVFLVCFVLYINVLGVVMRFGVRFCIYEHVQKYGFATFFENDFPRNDGDAKPNMFTFKLRLRPWDISHRVERQKLVVKSREEMSVRVWKGDLMANFFLHYNFRPNVLFGTL